MFRPALAIMLAAGSALAAGGGVALSRDEPLGRMPTGTAAIGALRAGPQQELAQQAALRRASALTDRCRIVTPKASEGRDVPALAAVGAAECEPSNTTVSRLRVHVFDAPSTADSYVGETISLQIPNGQAGGLCFPNGSVDMVGHRGEELGRVRCWSDENDAAHVYRSWTEERDGFTLVFIAESKRGYAKFNDWIAVEVRGVRLDSDFPTDVERKLVDAVAKPLRRGGVGCTRREGLTPNALAGVSCGSDDLGRRGVNWVVLEQLPETTFDANRYVTDYLASRYFAATVDSFNLRDDCASAPIAYRRWSGAAGAGLVACSTFAKESTFVASNTARSVGVLMSTDDAQAADRFWRSTGLGDDA